MHYRPYGEDFTVDHTLACAKSIRIVGDAELTMDSYFEDARKTLDQAKVICFVGFGYHVESLTRLGFPELAHSRKLFGTAYKLPKARLEEVQDLLPGIILGGSDEKTSEFFDQQSVLRQFLR